ncbi:accessory Sec system glycosyltransferase GtfA [Liquorilactobacillus hordei]|uniref:accessory Sec system glycosyltransferase GtfA n=1 Tax=Liquorilactobacillus hordei TaxID=468911 RepID=UPI0039EC0C6A
MTIYNFNHGIGWASSGVEYAQAYRAKIFRRINEPAKFIFTDFFPTENIENFTAKIGFADQEVIWLYQYFSDIRIAPNSFKLEQLEQSVNFNQRNGELEVLSGKKVRLNFRQENQFVTAYLLAEGSQIVERAEFVINNKLIRKDFYTYTKVFSEYYTPQEKKARLYMRRFFNQDGSIAYDQLLDSGSELYRFPQRILYSKEELLAYFIETLNLKAQDTIILDRATDIGQVVYRHCKPAKIGVVIHADHFSESITNETQILWNNYYEYQFDNAKRTDFFITATDSQNKLLASQFKKYKNFIPKIVTIPVGGLEKLELPQEKRRKNSLITASRLAAEKHIDWLVIAVIKAHNKLADISLDIYGEGGKHSEIEKIIEANHAESYIKLKGHHDLAKVYQKYEMYVSASTSEGFGLTLMEAVGSGLMMVGFDVRYGNQTFIEQQKNGLLLPYNESDGLEKITTNIANAIVESLTDFSQKDLEKESYEIGRHYLMSNISQDWQKLLEELRHD